MLYFLANSAKEMMFTALARALRHDNTTTKWLDSLRHTLRHKQWSRERIAELEQIANKLWDEAWAAAPHNQKPDNEERGAHAAPLTSRHYMSVQDAFPTPTHADSNLRIHALRNRTRQHHDAGAPDGPTIVPTTTPGLAMRTRGFINASPIVVLNDTGASVTVISTPCARRLQLDVTNPSDVTVVLNPNGAKFAVAGVVNDEISFDGHRFPFHAVVLDDLQADLILGEDFMQRHGVTLRYGDNTITYGAITIPVLDEARYTSTTYRRTDGTPVYAGDDITIDPLATTDVQARVRLPLAVRLAQYAWHFQPLTQLQYLYNIYVPDAIVRPEDNDSVIVRIASNGRDGVAVTIPAGTMMGTLRTLRANPADASRPLLYAMAQVPAANPGPPPVAPTATAPDRHEEFRRLLDSIIEGLPHDVMLNEREQLRELLVEYQGTVHAEKLGRANAYRFDIDPGTAKPVCHPDRRWSPQELAYIKTHIDQLLQQGLIEPSTSPWSSRLVCAPKKDASGQRTDIRVCVDFRDVNALTHRDAYPAPSVHGVLDKLHGMAFFTSMDLQKGFHQIDMTERARDICSFRCPFGFFRYTRLPFGIMNAPAAFQRMMDTVLRGVLHGNVMVYMDDVIIYTKTWGDHIARLRDVLHRIAGAGLTINLKKCKFACHNLLYLGHTVTKEGIRPEQLKVEAVRSVARPSNLAELQSFLGLTGVFRRFIAGYGDLARPLTEMTRKSEQSTWKSGSVWTEERTMAFEALKDAVCDDVTLAHPRFDRPLLMVCDASDYGMGAMLAQMDDEGHERPIAFTSATFAGYARAYTTTEKEGLAVAWAAAQFRPYIHGIPTVVVTDHAALTHILRKGVAPQRIARIVLDLAEYDFTYVHRKGSHNKVADAMSRLASIMSTHNAVVGAPDDFASPPVVNALRVTDAKPAQRCLDVMETEPTPRLGDGHPAIMDTSSGPSTHDPDVMDVEPLDPEPTPRLGDRTTTPPQHHILEQPATTAGVDHAKHASERRKPMRHTNPIYVAPDSHIEAVTPLSMTLSAFAAEQHADPECDAMFRYIMTGEEPRDPKFGRWVIARSDEFVVQETVLKHVEVIRHQHRQPTIRVTAMVPKTLRLAVMSACHDHVATGGHMGVERTYLRTRQYYWWPRQYADARDYVAACLTCQSTQKGHLRLAPLQQHVVPTYPFEVLAMDLLEMPTSDMGNRYAMVVIDHFSRYAIVVPIADKQATTVAKALMERVVLLHGHPAKLLTDRGPEFRNQLLLRVCELLSTKKPFTTPYRPQADGLAERFNRTLLKLLRAFIRKDQRNWDEVLPYILYAYNTSIARTTGVAPYTLIYGHEPPAPAYFDVLLETGQVRTAVNPSVWKAQLLEFLDADALEEARVRSENAKAKQRELHNQHAQPRRPLAPGTVVWVRNKQQADPGRKPKLMRPLTGLYAIVEQDGPVTYTVRRLASVSSKTRKLHADMLHPAYMAAGITLTTAPLQQSDPTASEDEDDTLSYEVDAITAMRKDGAALQFYVVWKGYPGQDSWEDERNLDCPALVESFLNSQISRV